MHGKTITTWFRTIDFEILRNIKVYESHILCGKLLRSCIVTILFFDI